MIKKQEQEGITACCRPSLVIFIFHTVTSTSPGVRNRLNTTVINMMNTIALMPFTMYLNGTWDSLITTARKTAATACRDDNDKKAGAGRNRICYETLHWASIIRRNPSFINWTRVCRRDIRLYGHPILMKRLHDISYLRCRQPYLFQLPVMLEDFPRHIVIHDRALIHD